MQKLTDKVALVTGGSRGIGAAIVKRLVAEGAAVTFTYVQGKQQADLLVKQLAGQGFTVQAVKADNAIEGEVSSAIEGILSKYGKFDILVNSAGIYIGKPFEEHTLKDYEKTMAVNVKAVVEAALLTYVGKYLVKWS